MLEWNVAAGPSEEERAVQNRLRRSSKFFAFLLDIRAELFDEQFQAELCEGYKTPRGQDPVAPGMLAMATLLQAYKGLSDADAVDAAENDQRWKMVLGTLGQDKAPFGQGSLVRFRQRMVAANLDQKLVERTVELAKKSGDFSWQTLKAALDSSPLLGAGRVEDTWNLLGRAISHVVEAVCEVTGIEPGELVGKTGLTTVGASSVKVALDIDWDDPEQRHEALQQLWHQVQALKVWVTEHVNASAHQPCLQEALDNLQRVVDQDLEPAPDGQGMQIRQGVARERMPSLGDPEMRHGRKSKTKPFTGYKRHIIKVVGTSIIAGGVVYPANQAEHEATKTLLESIAHHGQLVELAMDRGYLASAELPALLEQGVTIRCKPWPSRNGEYFTKEAFELDLQAHQVTCPNGITVPVPPSGRVQFPAWACEPCPLREQCTRSQRGRTVSIHPQEALLMKLREQKKSSQGRAALRERVTVEHGLAAVQRIQGDRARYKGARNNTLDLRRAIVVSNLQAISRMRAHPQQAAT